MPKKKADATGAKTGGEQSAKPITTADVSQFLTGLTKKAPQAQAISQTSVQADGGKLKDPFPDIADAELWHACQILQSWHPSIDNKELYSKAKAVSGSINKLMAMRDHVLSILKSSISSTPSDQIFAIQQVCWVFDDEGHARAGVVMKVVPWDFQFIVILKDQTGYKLEYIPFSDVKRKIDLLAILDSLLRGFLENLFLQHGVHLVEWLLLLSNQMLLDVIRIWGKSGDYADASFARDVLHIRESIMFQTSHKLDLFQAQESFDAKADFLFHLNTGTPLCTAVNECTADDTLVGHMKIVQAVSALLNEDFTKIQARCPVQISIPMTLKASLVKIAGLCRGFSRIYYPAPFMPNLYWLMAEVLEFLHEEFGPDSFWEPRKKPSEVNGALLRTSAAKQKDDWANVQPLAPVNIVYEISERTLLKAQEKMTLILARYVHRNRPEREALGMANRSDNGYRFSEANVRGRRPFDGAPGTNLLAAQWPRSSSADAINDASLRGGEKKQQTGNEVARGVSPSDYGETERKNSLEYDSWPASFGGMGSRAGGMLHSPLTHPNEELYEDVFGDEADFDWGDDLGFSGRPPTNVRPAFHQQDPFFDDDYPEPPPPPRIEPPPPLDDASILGNSPTSRLFEERTRVLEAFGGGGRNFGGAFQTDERPEFSTQEEGDEAGSFRLTSQFDNLSLNDSTRGQGDGLYQEIDDPRSDATKKSERGPPPPVPVRKYGKGQGANNSNMDV